MGQEKVEVEGTGSLQYLDRRGKSGLFACIRSSLVSLAQVKGEFRGARGLSHAGVLLQRTNVLNAFNVLLFCLVVKLFRSSPYLALARGNTFIAPQRVT
jgi:hypothetical protein